MTWNRDAILAAVHAWIDTHGKVPTSKNWKNAAPGHPAQSTVTKVFGSWNGMIEAAGFEPNPSNWQRELTFSREQILHEILEFRFAHGRVPTYRDFTAHDPERRRPTARTIARLFGSWNGALVAAGYEPRYASRSLRGYRAQMAHVTKAAA